MTGKQLDEALEFGKPFSITGMWWAVENQEDKHYGELSYSRENGIRLVIHGYFKNERAEPLKQIKYDIILGISTKATRITLLNCHGISGNPFMRKSDFEWDSYEMEYYYIYRVLVGSHFTEPSSIKFISLTAEYPLVDRWLERSSVSVKLLSEPKRIEILLDDSEKIRVSPFDGFSIVFPAGYESSFSFTDANVKDRALVGVESGEESNLDELEEALSALRDFLALGINGPLHPITLTGKRKLTSDEPGPIPNGEVTIVYELPIWAGETSRLYSHEMLLKFRDVEESFAGIIRRWYEIREEIRVAYESYFGNLYNTSSYDDHRFLSLIQGIESYHRARRINILEPQETFDQRKRRIREGLEKNGKHGDEDWEWLASKLSHTNEPSLRMRILDLLEAYRTFLPYIDDRICEWLAENIPKTRNSMMHPEEGRGERMEGLELVFANLTLKLLLEVIFLIELGLPKERISSMMRRTRDYKWAHSLGKGIISA